MPPWSRTTTRKTVIVGDVVGHAPPSGCSGVTAKKSTAFSFTAWDLALATAVCANRFHIPVGDRGIHARSMVGLIDLHVDAAKADFALEASADRLKDFVGTYLTGVIATGLAFLYMHQRGYVWFGHFEDADPGNIKTPKSPDFVFQHASTLALALVESKGTRKPTGKAFANKGYVKQVQPHLGHSAFGQMATHGFCIGARLSPSLKTDLVVVHTKPAVVGPTGGTMRVPPPAAPPPTGPTPVQWATFDRSMELVFGPHPAIDADSDQVRSVWLTRLRESTERNVVTWAEREWIVAPRRSRPIQDDSRSGMAFRLERTSLYDLLWLAPSIAPVPGAIWAFDKALFDVFADGLWQSGQEDPQAFCLDANALEGLRAATERTGGSVTASGLALLPVSQIEAMKMPPE